MNGLSATTLLQNAGRTSAPTREDVLLLVPLFGRSRLRRLTAGRLGPAPGPPPAAGRTQVRIQLAGAGNPFGVASSIVAKEGFTGLYAGLSAALLRQATYTTARLGLFQTFHDELVKRNDGKALPLYQKAGAGLAAGGLGAIVGSPADLSLIRMQADGTLPPEKRRNYGNVGSALVSIVKEEGVGGLFTGAGTTAVRAMALNCGMLASNSQAKEMLKDHYGIEGLPNAVGAGAIAGFFASAFSLPFDYVKTQIQKMQPKPDGTMPYSGMADCFVKTVSEHGPLRLYAGFPTYYIRIAPHCMITLVALDQIKKFQANNGY